MVQDILPNALTERADVLLPAASWAEKDGSWENSNGKIQPFLAVRRCRTARREGDVYYTILAGKALQCQNDSKGDGRAICVRSLAAEAEIETRAAVCGIVRCRDQILRSLRANIRSRVFIGGSYHTAPRALLSSLAAAVRDMTMIPVVADEYDLPVPEVDVHDTTLYLLHACRLAIFEVSGMSGALMEIERVADFGVHALVLYNDPKGRLGPHTATAGRFHEC